MNMPFAHFSGSAFVIPENPQALERRFQPVSVPEPTNEEAVQILRGIARKYEATSIPERMDEGWLQPRIFRPVNLTFTDILFTFYMVIFMSKPVRFSPRGEFRMVHVFGFRQAHHRIRYSEEALQSCVKFASQYIQDRPGDPGDFTSAVGRYWIHLPKGEIYCRLYH
jgi:hypothetical protein